MRHILMQSKHYRTVQKVITKTEEWSPGQKAVKPDGHIAKTQPQASRVYDEEWRLANGHLVRG